MEILNSSTSHRLSPKTRQIQWIVVSESPTYLASSLLYQCVTPSISSSIVLTTTSSICASVILRRTPPGLALSPATAA